MVARNRFKFKREKNNCAKVETRTFMARYCIKDIQYECSGLFLLIEYISRFSKKNLRLQPCGQRVRIFFPFTQTEANKVQHLYSTIMKTCLIFKHIYIKLYNFDV